MNEGKGRQPARRKATVVVESGNHWRQLRIHSTIPSLSASILALTGTPLIQMSAFSTFTLIMTSPLARLIRYLIYNGLPGRVFGTPMPIAPQGEIKFLRLCSCCRPNLVGVWVSALPELKLSARRLTAVGEIDAECYQRDR